MKTTIPLIILDHIKDGNKPQSMYDFNSYLTGFIQNNSKISIVSNYTQWINKINIIIIYNLKEIPMIMYLHRILGIGKIKILSSLNNGISYNITQTSEILKLLFVAEISTDVPSVLFLLVPIQLLKKVSVLLHLVL